MLTITELRKELALRKARRKVESLTSRQLTVTADALSRSSNQMDRIESIAIRSVLMGDTDKTFKKACKEYSKYSECIRMCI